MSAPTPRVSVCIPAYRAEATIGAAIASVLAQTIDDWELLVLDDCSPDATLVVARAFSDPRIRVDVQPTNVGAEANWNDVVARARGRYVKLLCSDDLLEPTCLARQADALDAHPSAVLAASPRHIIDARGRIVLRARGLGGLRGLVPGPQAARRLVRSGTNLLGEPSAVLFRRDALDPGGAFDGRHPYLIDVELYLRLLRAGDLVAVPEPLASFRVSPTSWSSALARVQGAQARALFHEEAARADSAVTRLDAALGAARTRILTPLRRAVFALGDARVRYAGSHP